MRTILAILLLASQALSADFEVHRDVAYASRRTSGRRWMFTLLRRAKTIRSSSGFMVAVGLKVKRRACRTSRRHSRTTAWCSFPSTIASYRKSP